MCGDVQDTALWTFFAEQGGSRTVGEVKRRIGKEGGDGFHLIQDLRRALVGDSQDERAGARACGFLLTQGEDRGAGSIGNGESVAEVLLAISQSMERQEMERTVGYENK